MNQTEPTQAAPLDDQGHAAPATPRARRTPSAPVRRNPKSNAPTTAVSEEPCDTDMSTSMLPSGEDSCTTSPDQPLPAPVDLEDVAPPQPPLSPRLGDQGWTRWQDTGAIVHKDNPRFVIVQSLDEICSILGIARSFTNAAWAAPIVQIQHDLISLQRAWACEQDQVRWAGFGDALRVLIGGEEKLSKEFNQQFNRTDYFPVPAGHPSATFLFYAKSVCWRAETFLYQLGIGGHLEETGVYLNSLARLLTLMARRANKTYGAQDLIDTILRETPDERAAAEEAASATTGIERLRPEGANRKARRERRR